MKLFNRYANIRCPNARYSNTVRISRIIATVLLLALLAAAGAGCRAVSDKTAGDEQAPQPITIGLLPIVDSLPFYVAEKNGYFADAGVEVELQLYQSAVLRDTAMQAGEIDGLLGDILAALALKNGGTDVKIVSVSLGATPAEGRFAILAAPGAKISAVDDLKRVEIALSPNTIIEYVVDRLLTSRGFTPDEIRDLVIPKIPDRYQMLMSGQIQAACLPDPFITLGEFEGAKVIVDDTEGLNLSQTVIVFTADAIANNAAGISRLFEAYSRAVEAINADPEAFRPLMVEVARLPEAIQATYVIDHFSPPQVPTREQVGAVIEWMEAKNLISPGLTYEDIVTDEFVAGN